MSSRAADAGHLRMSSSHPVNFTLSPQGSACAGIEPGTSRGHSFFALTHSMNKHGRAAAMVTPIGDKKTLLPAESAASRSGCAGRGRVQEGSSRRTNGSTQGYRERSDAKVCASASVAERARVRLCGLLLMYTSRSRRHWGWGLAPSTYTP